MLRTVEITAELTGQLKGDDFHALHFGPRLEFAVDCFICERTGRTQVFERGAERALCSGTRSGLARHYTPGRIAAYDTTSGAERLALRALVDFWWAPFEDKKTGAPCPAAPSHPWVRLHLGYHCPTAGEPVRTSLQTNVARPCDLRCTHCKAVLATDATTPAVRVLA